MRPEQLPLLKEVYEKRGKKMATDGREEPFAETVGTAPSKKVPPFMKGRNKPDVKADAKKEAAKRRLKMMRGGK